MFTKYNALNNVRKVTLCDNIIAQLQSLRYVQQATKWFTADVHKATSISVCHMHEEKTDAC